MKTKIFLKGFASLLALAVMFFFSSCAQDDDVLATKSVSKIGQQVNVSESGSLLRSTETHPYCGAINWSGFWAGKSMFIGAITLTNNKDSLYVEYVIREKGWVISETHLYVGSLSGVPKTKSGNPIPGHFPYKTVHNPVVTTYEYVIPMDALKGLYGEDSIIIITAHAAVLKLDENNVVTQEETAWSGCESVVKKGNWAYFTDYRIKSCD